MKESETKKEEKKGKKKERWKRNKGRTITIKKKKSQKWKRNGHTTVSEGHTKSHSSHGYLSEPQGGSVDTNPA